MLLKFYKSNASVGILMIPCLMIILVSSLFLKDTQPVHTQFFWQNQFLEIVWSNRFLNFTLTILLLGLNTLLLNRSFNRTMFFSKTTYVPSLIYLILISFYQHIGFSFDLVIHTLCIFLFKNIFLIDQNETAIHHVFKTAIITGVVVAISPHYLPLILISFIGLILIRPYIFKEYLAIILAIAVVSIWYISIKFILTGGVKPVLKYGQFQIIDQLQLIDFIQLSFFTIILILSFTKLRLFYVNGVSALKKQTLVLLNYLILMIISFVIAYFFLGQFDFTGIIGLVYLITIASLNEKSDTFISLILTLALVVNIISLFI